MPLSGLMATMEYAPDARYRARDKRAGQDRQPKPDAAAAPAVSDNAFDSAFFANRFKADLTALRAFDGADDPAPRPAPEDEPGLADFFGNLSTLLVAVRAGDISRAQAAADALELDALVERNAPRRAGASAPLLGDLVAQLSAARARGETAQSPEEAPAEPDAAGEETPDSGAAYDTLRHFLGVGPGDV